MRAVSLFSGIGGFDLGLERAGIETILQVEIDPFCRRVLEKHWPDVRRIADVRDVTAADCAGADLIYGGFPCQPVSTSGRRLGVADERWLWPEFARVVAEASPDYVCIENTIGLATLGLDEVVGDLRRLGYVVPRPRVVTACQVGAAHMRARLFIVAHPQRLGLQGPWGRIEPFHPAPGAYREADRLVDAVQRGALPFLCRGHDGVSRGVAGHRLHALGNAVVPQVAEYVGRRLVAFDAEARTRSLSTPTEDNG